MTQPAGQGVGKVKRRSPLRRISLIFAAVVAQIALLLGGFVAALWFEDQGTPGQAARSTGHDAIWLGHAWLDGRKLQSDVDALAARLRGTGVRDLLVHAGPFEDDGTLDPQRRPSARWFLRTIRAALPGIRVQAWLGAHPGEIDLANEHTRSALVASVGQVLDDGFDGVHLDFEPVDNDDRDLLEVLHATHALTQQRHALLSISAERAEPWPAVSAVITALPGKAPIWSGAYLHRVADEVDQIAVMAYETGIPSVHMYGGYVRTSTRVALDAVPANVSLLIGVPAYHEETTYHRRAESIAAALHGVRLALGDRRRPPEFGVAIYVDFTVTDDDWASYEHDWHNPPA